MHFGTLIHTAACPPTWYDQPFTGQFKEHCFYEPAPGTCDSVYRG